MHLKFFVLFQNVTFLFLNILIFTYFAFSLPVNHDNTLSAVSVTTKQTSQGLDLSKFEFTHMITLMILEMFETFSKKFE